MPTGTIKILKNGYGFIARTNDKDLHFYHKQLQNAKFDDLKPGDLVEFEEGFGNEGKPTAVRIKLIKQAVAASPPDGYRFLNPYNFVRFLEPGKPYDEEAAQLGMSPMPSHEVFSGLSGKIKCTFKTVTPLFVAQKITETADGHKELEMFSVEGSPRIPASSLRGMIRTVYESITNSCLEMVDNRRHSKHYLAREAYKFVPARAVKNGEQWELHLLPGATDLTEDADSKLQYAGWVCLYSPLKPKTLSRPFVNLNNLKHGSSCWGVFGSQPILHSRGKFSFWNIEALEDGAMDGSDVKSKYPGKRIEKGWLCINNQNTENKHDERFFFRAKDNDYLSKVLNLPDHVRQAYNELLSDYQKRHADEVRDRKKNGPQPDQVDRTKQKAALSRFIPDDVPADLQDGDLVYAEMENGRIKWIVPVSIPRILYAKRIADLIADLDAHLLPCSLVAARDAQETIELCPACRLFGWVASEKLPNGKPYSSFAGRVQFSDATFSGEVQWRQEPMTLAILGSPKPTTTSFYLLNQEQKPRFAIDYDTPGSRLRGRKLYRHHGLEKFVKTKNGSAEWARPEGKQNRQNVTIKKAIAENNDFGFEIRFENLHPIELGALLWSISLENGWYHRLGLAKPLGFGSIQHTSMELVLVDRQKRYQNLPDQAETPVQTWQQDYVALFRTAMQTRYGKPFAELPNYQDMQALLGTQSQLPIHYPRPTVDPDPAGLQFNWFVENKNNKHIALPLAPDDAGFEIFG